MPIVSAHFRSLEVFVKRERILGSVSHFDFFRSSPTKRHTSAVVVSAVVRSLTVCLSVSLCVLQSDIETAEWIGLFLDMKAFFDLSRLSYSML